MLFFISVPQSVNDEALAFSVKGFVLWIDFLLVVRFLYCLNKALRSGLVL